MMAEGMFGPYRLAELLGRGVMGDIYRAFDTRKGDREVAIKLLPEHLSADDGYQAMFRRESEIAALLREPHVIPIHDYGEIDGQLYIDMRLVNGVNLAQLLAHDGALPPARAVGIIEQVAAALDAVHAVGLIHRNVKKTNVMVTGTGIGAGHARDFVYLIDFGIAHAVDDVNDIELDGMVTRVQDYLAPERFLGGPVDRRADVYDLACVFYECLTNTPPYRGDLAVLLHAHLCAAAPRPSSTRPDLWPFDEVMARGMAKVPEQRYQSAGELAVAARAALARRMPAPAEGWGVFLSYRSSDTRHVAARLSEKLGVRLGDSRVFIDVGSIGPGLGFPAEVRAEIRRSAAMLVLIGPDWAAAAQDGRRRLDDPNDNVRTEIEEGLRARLLVIPVLIDGAVMPTENDLPRSLAGLAARHAVCVDHTSFRRDDAALVDLIEDLIRHTRPRDGGYE